MSERIDIKDYVDLSNHSLIAYITIEDIACSKKQEENLSRSTMIENSDDVKLSKTLFTILAI